MLLVARGFLSQEQLEAALDEQSVSGRRLGEILVERGFIPHSTLSLALAEQYGIHPSVERGFGTGLRGLLQRSDPEPELQSEVAAPVLELVTAPRSESEPVTHLEARLEEQWAQLAAVQEQLAAAEAELHSLHRLHARRRAQAGRLLSRLRAEQPARLAALEQLALSAQDLHSLHRLHERRRAQAGRLLAKLRVEQPARLAVQERLDAAEQELQSLHRVHARRHAQAGRLLARLRTKQPELASVREQLAGAEDELEALRRVHERRRAQARRLLARRRTEQPADGREDGGDHGHLVFVQLDGGYELFEREGRPPARDARLELADFPDSVFVVATVGRSPLPNDSRLCAFAQRAFA